jgi:16S rRNA processing protein RimM
MRPFAELVAIGRIVKPQGRKGEVAVAPLSDRPDRFPSLRHVFVPAAGGGSREMTVAACWPHKGRFVVKFEGIESIDDAETLRDLELRIGEEELEALPSGSYYHHQLKGLRVVEPGGAPIGEAVDILETGGAANVLVVRGAAGEVLIPLAEEFIREVDVAGGRLVAVRPRLVDERAPTVVRT